MPDSSPHSDRRAEAWSRIDTTKTEDMVPSSELRGWLAEYVGLFEQYEELGRDLDGKAFLKDAAEAKIRRLEEQLEALRQRLVKTRAEAEEYRELWQEAEGRS